MLTSEILWQEESVSRHVDVVVSSVGSILEKYKQFAGKTYVHHKNPLYLVDKEYELNQTEDLAPVCPNCHMILHSKK